MQALAVPPLNEIERAQVLEVLNAALQSPSFLNAPRASEFLRFIVERRIAGNGDQLKERLIGVAVFQRPPDYSTGEDSVVRVQAIDVRRRLDRFRATPEAKLLPVELSLPGGTYCPHLTFRDALPPGDEKADPVAVAESSLATVQPIPLSIATQLLQPAKQTRFSLRSGLYALLAVAVVCTAFFLGRVTQRVASASPEIKRFWAPLTSVNRPILVCVPRTASYRLTEAWFDQHVESHPGQFDQEWERLTRWPALAPTDQIKATDLQPMLDHGVGQGDTYSATAIAAGLTRLGHSFQIRIGEEYQFEDLRSSPSVLIGAFNNRWTMQLGASLPIHFQQVGRDFGLMETDGQKRTWIMKPLDATGRWVDYGIIARLPHAASGQPSLILGGAGRPATEVLGDFVTDEARLGSALSHLPQGWANKNVVFVLRTESTDGIAGPAQVVAARVW